jgi:endonuclease/exonuclease/phosphatase family metal-dependent hydrolase
VRFAGGNIAGRKKVRRLRSLLREWQPDVVVLTEAYWARPFLLALAAAFGYRLRQYGRHHGAEAPDIAVLVRRSSNIVSRVLVKMREVWWGPFRFPASKRRPRRYSQFELDSSGRRWDVEAIHFPPGGPEGGVLTRGKNKTAWHESAAQVRGFLTHSELAVALGDFNANRGALREHVAPEGAHVAMASSVDGVVTKGARITMHRLDAPAGMHGWFVADLTPISN